MKKKLWFFAVLFIAISLLVYVTGCEENDSNGNNNGNLDIPSVLIGEWAPKTSPKTMLFKITSDGTFIASEHSAGLSDSFDKLTVSGSTVELSGNVGTFNFSISNGEMSMTNATGSALLFSLNSPFVKFDSGSVTSYTITSPYSNVNWVADGQFKTALHNHTTASDGSATLPQMVEEHYSQDYDVLAITDHSYGPTRTDALALPVTIDWVSHYRPPHEIPLTQQRNEEVQTGTGRNDRGMLPIPNSSEILFAGREEINTFFFYHEIATPMSAGEPALRNVLAQVRDADGLAQLNHPGRSTGGLVFGPPGTAASNNPRWINYYSKLFHDFPVMVGMEIINRRDEDSVSDRILWDNILKVIIPIGQRNVWGFSNTDAHSNSYDRVSSSFNMFIMPENNMENVKSTMVNGNFYAVARIARHELGNNMNTPRSGPFPTITNIVVTNNESANAAITITAEHYDLIKWISNGAEIAEGNSITLGDYAENIGVYVRANIIGPGGISFTQPFIVTK